MPRPSASWSGAGSRLPACSLLFAGLIAATVYRAADGAARLHPDARPGLCHRRHPAARRRVARRAPTRWCKRASKIIAETPGVDRCGGLCRILGRHLHQCLQCRGRVRALRLVRGAARSRGCRQPAIIGSLYGRLQEIQEAFIIAIPPPPIRGIGNAGGFKIQLQERDTADVRRILGIAYRDDGQRPTRRPGSPACSRHSRRRARKLFLEIDRDKARMLNVPIPNIFETLSINLGTSYVNDFNAFGRVYQVRAQADAAASPRAGRHPEAQGPLGDQRPRADGHAGVDPRRDRSGARPALQHVCLGAAPGQCGPGHVDAAARSISWRDWRRRICRPGLHTNGPNWRFRNARPAIPRCSSSRFRCCSCSSRFRRNMKAGCCRSPSC